MRLPVQPSSGIMLLVVAVLVALPSAAPATVAKVWPEEFAGQPKIQIAERPLYFVWHDQNGWHVRWTTPGPHFFSGVVTGTGALRGVRAARGGLTPWLVSEGQRLTFLTATFLAVDGFDFHTTGETLTFSLFANQRLVRADQVHMGSRGAHPSQVPFNVTQVLFLGRPDDERIDPIDLAEILERAREQHGYK